MKRLRVGVKVEGGVVLAVKPCKQKGWWTVLRIKTWEQDGVQCEFNVHYSDGKVFQSGYYCSTLSDALSVWEAR